MGILYRVSHTWRKELVVDIDEVKEHFEDEWRFTQVDEVTEFDFLRDLVEEIGVDELEMSLIGVKTYEYETLEVEND